MVVIISCISLLYLSWHELIFKTQLQSFCTIHLPNAREALSLISLIFIFLTLDLYSVLSAGLNNIA